MQRPEAVEIEIIDGIDVPGGLKRLGLDLPEFYMLLQGFARNQVDLMADLERSVEGRDIENVRLFAHSLAGAAGNVAAVELAQAARDLEHATEREDADLASLYKIVSYEFERVFKSITAMPGAGQQPAGQEGAGVSWEPAEVVQLLSGLERALEEYDPVESESIMSRLTKFIWPAEYEDEVQTLSRQVENLEYESALERIGAIRQKLEGKD
jgi:HPt (histidine-containing phosphotransfer) domain-containing protein